MNKGKEAFHNNLYALRLMWQICPSQVLHKAITRFLGYFEWLFYSAFFMRFVIKASGLQWLYLQASLYITVMWMEQ